MKKAIELLEKVEALVMVIFSDGENSGECDEIINHLNDAMALLRTPRWETPEQWEKRTGEKLDANAAVYFKWDRTVSDWGVCRYQSAIRDHDICVVATEAGPPPDGWRLEEVLRIT
jgi:hypothetical protein